MTYLFIPQAGDREAIDMRLSALENATKAVLISTYNKYKKTGIVGVRAQIHGILALHYRFNAVFGSSPISIKDQFEVSLQNPVVPVWDHWEFEIED
jgi:hypothetical protein